MITLLKVTMLALLLGGANLARAAEPMQTGAVLLILREGIAPAKPGDQFTSDLELELTLRDGKFDPKVWGYSMSFNKAFHDGNVVKAEGDRLTIQLTLQRDRWSPPKPGTAQYEIALQRQGDRYAGTFTGRLSYPGGDGPVEREVKGSVTGSVGALWSEPRPGFEKLAPNEHPRLIFRKRDLPAIQQRLATPEGKAIMARFLQQLPKSHGDWPKVQMYLPAGYGLAWQLTGDKAHADKAKESLTGMLDLKGRQDIHWGPMAQAMAVTLDFCYDAWDAGFRQRVIDNLAQRLAALHAANMGGVSLNPHHNHEAIRVAGTGLAALCLLGEKTGNGKDIPDLDRILAIAARATRRYFLYNGTSGSGWGLEGDFYKRMTWNSGPGHVVQAWRTALGADLVADGLGAWSILGEWMWLPPGDSVAPSEGLRSGQDSGLFILGLTTVPDSMKAGARWLFDRSYGLQGDKTFNLLWAYHAAYLLMNYPFDVPAKPPTESLPWVAPDPTGGHWVFRKPWQGAQDTLVVLNPRFDNPGGTHWITGKSWDMQLFALGKLWIGDRKMEEKTGAPGAALPTTGNPQAFTDNLSARLTDWHATPAGAATLSFDMSPIYMRQLARGETPPTGQKLVRMSRTGSFVDLGIRARRSVALDLTGASGAPVLFALLDQAEGAEDFTWNMKLAEGAGPIRAEGNTFTVGDPAGPHLRAFFVPSPGLDLVGREEKVLPPAPREVPEDVPEALRGMIRQPAPTREPAALRARGSRHYFVVITVQDGKAPAVSIEGEGPAAKVTVGGQTVRRDGQRLIVGK